MEKFDALAQAGKRKFIFIGEAGSGKSEIALNAAVYLAKRFSVTVHFFDMDMTKPLFRSRDLAEVMKQENVIIHFEEQFFDAPTLVGGVNEYLNDPDSFVVMDVGGDHVGARSIGGFILNSRRKNYVPYYVLNAYRPWSDNIDHVDGTLGQILAVCHIQIQDLHMISNPNLGADTSVSDVIAGADRMDEVVGPYIPVDFVCVKEELYDEVKALDDREYFPLHRYLEYPWMTETAGE